MISALLLDIEGTVGSIAFVRETLFPYARQHLPAFVAEHAADPAVIEQLAAARELAGQPDLDTAATVALLQSWIDEDRKATPLKTLQGLLWKHGYRSGAYRAHVYDDAVRAMHRWADTGLPMWIYSSGSVAAQELFFKHTVVGDLRNLFQGHFDTTTGSKKEPASYETISDAMGKRAGDVLFLSDSEPELDAAARAGMRTTQVARPGETQAGSRHPVIASFDELDLP